MPKTRAQPSSEGYTLYRDASLAARNTLRVAARARQLVILHNADALPAILGKLDAPPLVLGEGSNVLFTGDYDGSVLVMATRGIEVGETDTGARIALAAGENWDAIVRWSVEQGYTGLENLSLIPGTAGAAPIQNIGAYGVEIAEFIDTVEAWDRREQRHVVLDNAACQFAYRDSRFKHEPCRYIILQVHLRLTYERPLTLGYAGLQQELSRMGVTTVTAEAVAAAVRALRRRKLHDPAEIGNAGSFFKNPIVTAIQADELTRDYPEMKQWPLSDGRVKLSAAWLIETCGLKGTREGDAGISGRHALVLVNHDRATGSELWHLARRVVDAVDARFQVTLEPEPRIIGPGLTRQPVRLPG